MVIEISMLHQCPKQIGSIDTKDAKDAKDEDMCVHMCTHYFANPMGFSYLWKNFKVSKFL
jgi:hypothetical protein